MHYDTYGWQRQSYAAVKTVLLASDHACTGPEAGCTAITGAMIAKAFVLLPYTCTMKCVHTCAGSEGVPEGARPGNVVQQRLPSRLA
jgi:hypothetical protein